MNLSQEEIEAMMAGGSSGDSGDSDSSAVATAEPDTGGDIMSPDAIAAMLDAAGGGDPEPAAASSDSGGDIMSPEAIAAMLDTAGGGDPEPAVLASADENYSGGDVSNMMSPEAIAAMLENAGSNASDGGGEDPGGSGGDMMSPEDIAAMLDGEDEVTRGDGYPSDATHGVEVTLSNVPELEGMLTEEEVDVLGEIGNISMGAVATTMYTLLDRRVSITTPRVRVFESKDVLSVYQVPFVVATIEYTLGITGTNLLVLKIEDAALITDLLMGGDGTVEEPIELNEMHLSAMSEIMNQMMGASSTSLAKLLGTPIDIAPPRSSTVEAGFDVSSLLGDMDKVTKISFDMEIEGLLKSELIQLVPYDVSRGFAKQFMEAGAVETSAPAPAAPPPAAAAPPPAAAAAAPPPPMAAAPPPPPPQEAAAPPPMQPYPQQPPMGDPYAQAPYPQAPYPQPYPQAPYPQPYPPVPYQQPPMAGPGRVVDVHPMQFQAFDGHGPAGETKGIDLVYNIPLQVSVELGRAKKEISEILEFSLGTIVVLDKIAGDPVEIIANGKLIARGEVVVIDDNYGVRITDIING